MMGGAKQSDFDDFITALFSINFGPALEHPENIVKGFITYTMLHSTKGLKVDYQVVFQLTQSWSFPHIVAAS